MSFSYTLNKTGGTFVGFPELRPFKIRVKIKTTNFKQLNVL